MPWLAGQAALVLVLLAVGAAGEGRLLKHQYKQGDLLPLFASKIGPFANPTETYQYYDLP